MTQVLDEAIFIAAAAVSSKFHVTFVADYLSVQLKCGLDNFIQETQFPAIPVIPFEVDAYLPFQERISQEFDTIRNESTLTGALYDQIPRLQVSAYVKDSIVDLLLLILQLSGGPSQLDWRLRYANTSAHGFSLPVSCPELFPSHYTCYHLLSYRPLPPSRLYGVANALLYDPNIRCINRCCP